MKVQLRITMTLDIEVDVPKTDYPANEYERFVTLMRDDLKEVARASGIVHRCNATGKRYA